MTEENKDFATTFKTRVMPIIAGIIMVAWFFVIALSSK